MNACMNFLSKLFALIPWKQGSNTLFTHSTGIKSEETHFLFGYRGLWLLAWILYWFYLLCYMAADQQYINPQSTGREDEQSSLRPRYYGQWNHLKMKNQSNASQVYITLRLYCLLKGTGIRNEYFYKKHLLIKFLNWYEFIHLQFHLNNNLQTYTLQLTFQYRKDGEQPVCLSKWSISTWEPMVQRWNRYWIRTQSWTAFITKPGHLTRMFYNETHMDWDIGWIRPAWEPHFNYCF